MFNNIIATGNNYSIENAIAGDDLGRRSVGLFPGNARFYLLQDGPETMDVARGF